VRIAIVSEYYYPQLGGVTEHVHGQGNELVRRGHEVTLVTPKVVVTPKAVDGGEPPSERLFELVRIARGCPFYMNGSETRLSLSPLLVRQLDRLYAKRRFDVVHVHSPWGVALPMVAVVRSIAPVTVGTIHSVVPEGHKLLRCFRPLVQAVFSQLDERIAVSEAVVDSIHSSFPGLSFEVIPNGIDTGFFSAQAAPLPQLLGGKRNILFIGRFDPRNGLKHMLRAFVLLRERRQDVRLVVVGDGPLGRLLMRIVPAGLRDDVLFEGRINHLRPRYLASVDILCSPCQLASFGMVLLEAMSAGVPVVASSISGFRLLIQDGVQGLLVDDATDESQLADALDRLLSDPERARRMGAAGRERAVQSYAWPVVVDQLEDLYERLGAPNSKRSLRAAAR
jgi:phosphatidylinositol alpha-mannosyltransferase